MLTTRLINHGHLTNWYLLVKVHYLPLEFFTLRLMSVFIITLTVQAPCWAELAQCVWRIQSLWQKKHRKGLELNHRVCGSRMPCQLVGDLKFNHSGSQSYFFWKMYNFFIRKILSISHATSLLRKSRLFKCLFLQFCVYTLFIFTFKMFIWSFASLIQ